MLKLLVLGLLLFLAYRLFWANPGLGGPDKQDQIRDTRPTDQDDEGDYVDYEEVD